MNTTICHATSTPMMPRERHRTDAAVVIGSGCTKRRIRRAAGGSLPKNPKRSTHIWESKRRRIMRLLADLHQCTDGPSAANFR